jgi:hypothetical protein
MTTIAYHHGDKQIAIDSRTTSGGLINTDKAIKVYKFNNYILFMCGSLSDIEIFIGEYPDIKTNVDCGGFLIENKVAYGVYEKDGKLCKFTLTYNDADGSGYAFALAAMDFGCDARGAVKYAMTRDIYTGGRIKVIDVK